MRNQGEEEVNIGYKSFKCSHCFKNISKRRLFEHQAKCKAVDVPIPEGFKSVKVQNKDRLRYHCPCGYQSRRCRLLKHLSKCQKSKQTQVSTLVPSSISDLQIYRNYGIFSLISPQQLAPVVVESIQSISKTIKEIQQQQRQFIDPVDVICQGLTQQRTSRKNQRENQLIQSSIFSKITVSDSSKKKISQFLTHMENFQIEESQDYNQRLLQKNQSVNQFLDEAPEIKNTAIGNLDVLFDNKTHPKFSQFRQARQEAPTTNQSNRYRIFTVSLLLRFTGYFQHDLQLWIGTRCKYINTERFMNQLNSHTSIFKSTPRTLIQVREDLQDIATVDDDIINLISVQLLISRLKEALENYQFAAIWYRAHTAPLVERRKKRAPRAHWETRNTRRYIANTKWKNRKWGVSVKPMTLMRLRQREFYCQEIDQMYLMKYHMSRPLPKKHRKKYFEKKNKLMIKFAIHRIADAFTADFYVDFLMYQMDAPKDDPSPKVKIFQSRQAYQKWQSSLSKQIPTTCIWLAVSRLYLQKRKSVMSAVYYSCQKNFKQQMPKKSEEEIYQLVIKWYQNSNMIDKDDDWELKQYCTNPNYSNNIKNQAEQILNQQISSQWPKMDEQMPQDPPVQQISVTVALPKPFSREFLPKSDLTIYQQKDILQDNHLYPKLKKQMDCMDFQLCSKRQCSEWLNGNLLICTICEASYHQNCWPKNDFCNVCQLMNDSEGFSRYIPSFIGQKYLCFPQLGPILVKPPTPLFIEGEKAAIKQVQEHFFKQTYCVINYFHEDFILYPFYNSDMKRLHPQDQNIINCYEEQKMAFPAIVHVIDSIKGKGLIARRPIKKGELVATYSGNVMSMAQVAKYGDKTIKEYAFHLASGPDVKTNYAVYPQDFASAGFFINHSKSKNKINTKASIAIAESGPIILLQAIKKIDYGEELLYDYNGFYNSYETSNFK